MTKISITEGDTLYKLAQVHGTTVQKLQELNDIENPDLIKVGEQLQIPDNPDITDITDITDGSDNPDVDATNMFGNPEMLQNMLNLLSNGMNDTISGDENKELEKMSDKSSESSYTTSIDNLNDIAHSIFVNNNGENICEILTKINDNLSTFVQRNH